MDTSLATSQTWSQSEEVMGRMCWNMCKNGPSGLEIEEEEIPEEIPEHHTRLSKGFS